MTQEHDPALNSLRYGMNEASATFQQEVDLAKAREGGVIRAQVRRILSACGENVPPSLTLYKEPDIRLDTQTCELVNIFAQRPQPLQDIAWFILRDKIVVTLERVITSQSI